MPVESPCCELHLTHGAETKDSISSFYVYPFEIVSAEGFTPTDCAHFVLNSTLAGIGLSESE